MIFKTVERCPKNHRRLYIFRFAKCEELLETADHSRQEHSKDFRCLGTLAERIQNESYISFAMSERGRSPFGSQVI